MKKSRYTGEQVVSISREAESVTVTATARKHGVAEQTIYRWRRQHADQRRTLDSLRSAAKANAK